MKPAMQIRAIAPLAFVLAYVLFSFSPLVADPDLWGHVRFGQDALRTGQIVQSDVYSYLTHGQWWINHEWLAEILYASAFNLSGPRGLIILNTVVSLLIVALVISRLRARGSGGAVLLVMGFALLVRPGVLNVRPQASTYLLFCVLLVVLAEVETHHAERASVGKLWLPAGITALLFALWINLHGGVLAGLGILFAWGALHLAEAVLQQRSWQALFAPRQRPVLLMLAVAPLALLLNPYGPDLVRFLLRTATVARPEIVEWQPVRLAGTWGQLWLAGVVVTGLAIALSRRPRRLALLGPLAITAALPLLALRHTPLFAVAAPILAADHLAGLWDRITAMPVAHRISKSPVQRYSPAAWLAAGAILLVFAAPRLQRIEIQPASAGFPVVAVAVLEAANIRGNMATEFNWGEYVIWHLGPGVQVSIDGRRETVYPDAVYRENLDFMRGEGQWDRLADRPETDLALVDRGRPVYGLMQGKAGWVLAYEDALAAIFVRAGSSLQEAISTVPPVQLPADGAGLAFP